MFMAASVGLSLEVGRSYDCKEKEARDGTQLMSADNSLVRLVIGTNLRRLVSPRIVLGLTVWVPFAYLGLHSVGKDTPILGIFVLVGFAIWSILLRSALSGFYFAATGRRAKSLEDGILPVADDGGEGGGGRGGT
jgi:hypothetical protein